MEAYPAGTWPPEIAGGMVCQDSIEFPVLASIGAGPEAGWIDPCVDGSRFTGAARLDYPDVFEFLLAIFGKLNALLGFLPCLTKIIAVAQKCAKEVAVVRCEQSMAAALIENGVEDAMSFQSCRFDFPRFPIL